MAWEQSLEALAFRRGSSHVVTRYAPKLMHQEQKPFIVKILKKLASIGEYKTFWPLLWIYSGSDRRLSLKEAILPDERKPFYAFLETLPHTDEVPLSEKLQWVTFLSPERLFTEEELQAVPKELHEATLKFFDFKRIPLEEKLEAYQQIKKHLPSVTPLLMLHALIEKEDSEVSIEIAKVALLELALKEKAETISFLEASGGLYPGRTPYPREICNTKLFLKRIATLKNDPEVRQALGLTAAI